MSEFHKTKIVDVQTAIEAIPDNATVATSGFVGTGIPEYIYFALSKHFEVAHSPKNLTIMYAAGQGDGKDRGLNHLAKEGLVGRVIGGHWGLVPKFNDLLRQNKIQGYNLPQGVISHLYRDIAADKPVQVSRVGIGTFVDPVFGGGKLNSITTEDLVSRINIAGTDYLMYKTWPVNVGIIRGSTADTNGNISMHKEALTTDSLAIAMAAHNSGGIVIVQVDSIAERGSLSPRAVEIPGILVDYIVLCTDEDLHMQTMTTRYRPSFSGESRMPLTNIKAMDFDERKIIARRAALELKLHQVINLGIGMPEGIAQVAAEEKIIDYLTLTTEPGAIGGVPASGLNFGASDNAQAIITQQSQFDFYDGGGLDLTFLGLAQADQEGNLNVSKFGPKLAGAGGFINISQNTHKVVFVGTFTAGGLKVEIKDGKIHILHEGKVRKFITAVEHRTFSGEVALKNKQDVLYITERCVFRLVPSGLELIEIAPGIDLEKDILAHMDFTPAISPDLKEMDALIFTPAKMNLLQIITHA